MFVYNYLHIIYEQLNMKNRFIECWSGYFWSIIFEWTTNLLAHGANDYQKLKIWGMRIIEKTQQIKIWFRKKEISKYYFWLSPPPYKNSKNRKRPINSFWWMFKIMFWCTPFYIRNIICLSKILRALLSNKNRILHFWKSQ